MIKSHEKECFHNNSGKANTIVALAFSLVFLFGFFSYAYVVNLFGIKGSPDYVLKADEGVDIDIPTGASTAKISEVLTTSKVISYPKVFKLTSKLYGYDGMYKSGVHTLSTKMSYEQIMKALTKNPKIYQLTIPEGFNIRQVAEAFSSKGIVSKADIEKLIDNNSFNYKFLDKIPLRKSKLEGYLFPDTYQFGIYETPDSMVKKILNNFNSKFKHEYYKRAEELKYSTDQIITMASIIEKEAYVKEDRKIIAGVFYNRLKSRDKNLSKLQSCATVQYIFFMKNGAIKEKLSEKDTRVNDSYNTYIFPGLPPGPIASPGLDSIEAALYPENSDYMYFVAKPDRSHAFAKTYNEHMANIKKYGG